MASFDFPVSPTVGQAYTLNGVSYVWNGYAWMQAGQPLVQGVQYPAHEGAKLYWVSNTSVGIRPINGGRLLINGESRPVTPVTKPSTFFTPQIISYVYAFWTGTALDYEASPTAPAPWTDGVKVKTGDATRTFIGVLHRSADGNIYDTPVIRDLLSEFGRQPKTVEASVNGTVASTTMTAVAGAAAIFIMHPDDQTIFVMDGYVSTNATDYLFTAPAVDTVPGTQRGAYMAPGAFGSIGGIRSFGATTYARHTLQGYARNSAASTATMVGGVYGVIQG